MYNRYIPQQDGSHKRNRMEEAPVKMPPPQAPPHPPAPPQPSHESTCPTAGNIGTFLRRLIPRDFDTGDLIVVLLLLLMAGDNEENRNTALLTMALYCFL